MTGELEAAANALKNGHLVAFPTETVYGLGADAENESAVARIYLAKGRPADHPLIVHIYSQSELSYWAKAVPEYALALANTFWPGPMTLILERSSTARDFVTGSQDTVGVRVPNHPVALALLAEFLKIGGKGIAAPSANRFGQVSPTTADAVRDELGQHLEKDDVILDGGFSEVGIESTIIDCRGSRPKILRPGSITAEMIEAATALSVDEAESTIRVSGALENHYAPKAKVILDAVPEAGDGFIAFSNMETPDGVIRLAAPETLEQFAKELYQSLREADKQSLSRVVIWQPTGHGLAIAIRDRLLRASTKS
jgi:L-threonylcarbamoyladenylate synthase